MVWSVQLAVLQIYRTVDLIFVLVVKRVRSGKVYSGRRNWKIASNRNGEPRIEPESFETF